MSEMVYVSLRTDKPGTVNSFTVMMKANSRPAPVLRLVPDRDSRNNSVRPTARLRAVSDFQFSIRDRPCRHLSRLSVSRWNRLFECPAPRIGRRPRLRKTWFGSHSPQYGWFCDVFYRQMFPSITHKFLYLIYTTMVVLQCLHATLSFQRIQCPLQQWRKQPFLFPIHHYSLFLVYYCIIMVKKEKDFG